MAVFAPVTSPQCPFALSSSWIFCAFFLKSRSFLCSSLCGFYRHCGGSPFLSLHLRTAAKTSAAPAESSAGWDSPLGNAFAAAVG